LDEIILFTSPAVVLAVTKRFITAGLCVLAAAALAWVYLEVPSPEEQPESGVPHEAALCRDRLVQVMSPEYDWGCVDAGSARILENRGWYVLDEYPEDLASGHLSETPGNLAETESWPPPRHMDDGLEIELRMPELPLVGQSADVILDVVYPHAVLRDASPVNASFQIRFIGDVLILSPDYAMKPKFVEYFGSSQIVDTPKTMILPGETRRFNVTVLPVSQTPLEVWADGYQNGYLVTQSDARIRVSIGSHSSGYQLDGDSYARDPDTRYVWTAIPYPQCWAPPWDQNGQSVQDYYADRGIEVHDTEWLGYPAAAVCDLCTCGGGLVMFLTPEHDRADVLEIAFGVEYGWARMPFGSVGQDLLSGS